MYDLSGVYHIMEEYVVICGGGGLMFLLTSRFWNPEKRNKKELIIGLVCAILCIVFFVYYYNAISNLSVSVHEGAFVSENRKTRHVFSREYCFSAEDGLKPVFYLDLSSKKKIYPEKFEKGEEYRIYYEEKTNIIVKVEKLE